MAYYKRKSYGSSRGGYSRRTSRSYGSSRKRVYGKAYGKRTRGRSANRKSQQTVRIVIQQPSVSAAAPVGPFETTTQKRKAQF